MPYTVVRRVDLLPIPSSPYRSPICPSKTRRREGRLWARTMHRRGDLRLVVHNPNDLHASEGTPPRGRPGSWLPMVQPAPKEPLLHNKNVGNTQGMRNAKGAGDRRRPDVCTKATVADVCPKGEVSRAIPPYPHTGPSCLYYACMKGSMKLIIRRAMLSVVSR